MFRSAADISSDSQSSSDGDDYEEGITTIQDHDNGQEFDEPLSPLTQAGQAPRNTPGNGSPDLQSPTSDVGGHANMMTAALLEFYCHSRAADILNAQPGSHGRFHRESPEAQYLGRRLYEYKSQFLSSHGVLTGGVDKQELGTTRQYYRDNLDRLGLSALEDLKLDDVQGPSRPGSSELALPSKRPKPRRMITDQSNVGSDQDGMLDLRELFQKEKDVEALDAIRLNMHKLPNQSLPPLGGRPSGLPLLNTQSPSAIQNSMSRYALEFSEIRALGRGSFGQVYHVMNHIDGQHYAVKKIPISRKRLEQLRTGGGGQNQLEYIMKEIRTLARLEHMNIVRYYGAWVEQAPTIRFAPSQMFQQGSKHEQSQNNLPRNEPTEEHSFGIVFEQSEDPVTESQSGSGSVDSHARSYDKPQRRDSHATTASYQFRKGMPIRPDNNDEAASSPERPRHRGSNANTASYRSRNGLGLSLDDENLAFSPQKSRRDSHATVASHHSRKSLGLSLDENESEIESIPRNFSIPSFGQMSTIDSTNDDIFTDGLSQEGSKLQLQRKFGNGIQVPAVVLHIQMSLHPISLGSYLSPQSGPVNGDGHALPRRHCYHLSPSLGLMLDVISGVEYLHSKGIVHRDLKPPNIFLSNPENSNLRPCSSCELEDRPKYQYCHPRIGDFGLVADIQRLNDTPLGTADSPLKTGSEQERNVGTEFYRPCMSQHGAKVDNADDSDDNAERHPVDEKLDIYALGVILFELLYRLNTKMERQMVLTELTRGKVSHLSECTVFPGDFAQKIDLGPILLDDGTSFADALMSCISGMLEPDPQRRWTCSDVKGRLGRILAAIPRVDGHGL